jgi:curved DNA-binding protein CbpA/DNA-directed RNA polymerase subunit RPC12/RpoP
MARAVVTEDYYAILEVSQFASLDSIRESYKKLALKFHPDKNKEESATSDFQLLVKAWETLKDGAKRAEYDRAYVRVSKRTREDGAKDEVEQLKTRREEVERQVRYRWAEVENSASTLSADEAARRGTAKAWQAIARKDYISRVQTWFQFRKQRITQILEIQRTVQQLETDLNAQKAEDEEEVTRRFQDAITRSSSSGHDIEDHATTLAKLLEARKSYTSRLSETVAEFRKRLEPLLLELENDRRRYEQEEAQARNLRIRRALELLGPRDLNAPLFSLIDRRGKAINCWKALARIEPATNFSASLGPIDEGPWHMPGEWERVSGEQTCGRCGQRAFHLIPEWRPLQCPGCSLIVCINCHRSIKLLQEYEQWVTSPFSVERDYLFSVVFASVVKPSKVWSGAPRFDGAFDNSRS